MDEVAQERFLIHDTSPFIVPHIKLWSYIFLVGILFIHVRLSLDAVKKLTDIKPFN